jgi:enoyl-CoA hydratase
MSDTLRISHPQDGVALVELNRPKRLNALNNELMRALGDALERFAADGTTRAVVIAGDERAFAAGADIGEFQTDGPDLAQWDRLWASPLPRVAAVRGLALGGGLELAMSCDLFVVADDARLGQPEINLGVMPGAGGTQRLVRAVGKAIAMEMVLLGRELSGREACERGLANRSVPAEQTLSTALELAAAIALKAPIAIRTAKRAIDRAFEASLGENLRAERADFYALLTTDDAREGIAAFVERRPPTWSNQ